MAIQTTTAEAVKTIEQDRLEAFVDQRYHWKSLSPSDQQKMARELLSLRAFLLHVKNAMQDE